MFFIKLKNYKLGNMDYCLLFILEWKNRQAMLFESPFTDLND